MSTDSTIAVATVRFSDEQLAEIKSFADFDALTKSLNVVVEDVKSYGTGFEVLADKGILIGVPIILVEWHFTQGDKGEFVSIAVLTSDGRKLIVNDGSTGIRDQVKMIEKQRESKGVPTGAPLYCAKGLRRSVYDVENPSKPGEMMQATTYYLSI